jgi:methylthioribose-1-phosphate isomerase
VEAFSWTADGAVRVLDQTVLPAREEHLTLETAEDTAEAIVRLRVRGAPAIGIVAAMGLVAGLRSWRTVSPDEFLGEAARQLELLGSTRPTAVNLRWALERMRRDAWERSAPAQELWERLRDTADRLWADDREMCRRIGEAGLSLVPDGSTVLTHCNAGALATGGIGTALAPIYRAHELGRSVRVIVGETRPVGQGARLTAWELHRAGVPATVVVDGATGSLMRDARIDVVLVGADRVARNGDTANKIGTYSLAVLAQHHRIPVYVCMPSSTIDVNTPAGDGIPIEQRDAAEVSHPQGVGVLNPAFDVTPADYITGWITDSGLRVPPFGD